MMKHRHLGFILICSLLFSPIYASEGLDYLNTMRMQAGLVSFSEESHLSQAAQNHSNYLKINNTTGHYEEEGKEGFTGVYPSDRVVDAGYLSQVVSENVSAGREDVIGSIDGLFSAIYHRFGFLSLTFDEIGIGSASTDYWDLYTYDMGIAGVRQLCEDDTYVDGAYVLGACADETQKISATDWESATNIHKSSAPELIVWPPVNGSDIPPVFYEESPDPLPDYSVSGYPISVEFNDGKFSSVPSLGTFTVKDAESGTELESIIVMDKSSDPNDDFTDYQVAFFPKKRLEWGSVYDVVFSYNYDGNDYTKSWCFSTRSLNRYAQKFYEIDNKDISLKVVSGTAYAIYAVPAGGNDVLGGVAWSYTCDTVDFSYIDNNTVLVTVTGDAGEYVSFSFDNDQNITLTISDSDTATVPAQEVCSVEDVIDTDGDGIADVNDWDDDNDGVADSNDAFPLDASESVDTDGDGIGNNADSDDDNDGISDQIEIANGLNPLNASDGQADFDGDGFSNAVEISLGADFESAESHPVWTPVIMGDIMITIPSY